MVDSRKPLQDIGERSDGEIYRPGIGGCHQQGAMRVAPEGYRYNLPPLFALTFNGGMASSHGETRMALIRSDRGAMDKLRVI